MASSIVLPSKKVEWSQIEPLIVNQKDQAFRVALSSRGADSDTSQMVNVIRLMCRTGVCLDSLSDQTQTMILDWSVKMLSQKDFIDVLLAWVS